jgi:hypothetical protein
MGVTHGELRKKNKSSSTVMKQGKKNLNRDDQNRRITFGKNQSQMTKNFKNEYETSENKPQSKTDKTIDDTKKIEEDIKNKSHLDTIKNLKCLSTEKLFKIENHNFNNHEDNLPNSYETNFSSTKSNEDLANKLLYEDIYNGADDNNSIDEEDEDENEENEEKDEEQNEEEKKKNVMLITNNIKAVFVDSKLNGKEQKTEDKNKEQEEKQKENEEINEQTNIPKVSSETSISSSTFDYELNFYRNGNDIRQSYISKLITKNVWIPNMKPKQHNSLIIFDWDDTLLPTSFLTPGGVFNEDITLSESDQDKMLKLEQSVFTLLNETVEKGNVYIITNAGKGWVEYSARRFYPKIVDILSKIKIISARGEYEKIYPGNSRQWKIQAFLNLLNYVDVKLVTNIICVGDSLFEMEAGRILASKFTEAFIKTIKFREAPKLDELIKQLKLVCVQFGAIYSSIKNLTIRVEKKKREND